MSWNILVRIPAEEAWGDLEGDMLRGAIEVVDRAGDLAVARVRQLLRSSGSGPAAPGEPAHERTGELGRSVVREAATLVGSGKSARRVSGRVIMTDPGAARLEFGAVDRRGIRTFPHPTLRVAFEDTAADIDALFHAWARAT